MPAMHAAESVHASYPSYRILSFSSFLSMPAAACTWLLENMDLHGLDCEQCASVMNVSSRVVHRDASAKSSAGSRVSASGMTVVIVH